jgi:hypothetical protein
LRMRFYLRLFCIKVFVVEGAGQKGGKENV